MIDRINDLLKRVEEFRPKAAAEVEEFRIKVLGKKGELNALMEEFKSVAPEHKREIGQRLNALKTAAQERINALKAAVAEAADLKAAAVEDMTRPGTADNIGSRHPISLVRNQIVEIFSRLGYTVAEGPGNRGRLARILGPELPARAPRTRHAGYVLHREEPRHTAPYTHLVDTGARHGAQQTPIRIVCPGRVFRNEAISYRAHCIFHQVEGLYIDEGVSFADLKQSLLYFAKEMFGEEASIRLRPSYFPFTEPSAEMDVSCNLCGGKGCNVCKGTGWLEIMGCGMVDPNVLEANGIDSKKYSGFAFGMGIERIAMLKYGVKDLRLYFENDVRFLRQFESVL